MGCISSSIHFFDLFHALGVRSIETDPIDHIDHNADDIDHITLPGKLRSPLVHASQQLIERVNEFLYAFRFQLLADRVQVDT